MKVEEIKDWGNDTTPRYQWIDGANLQYHINHGGSRILCRYRKKVSEQNYYVGYACLDVSLNQDGYTFKIKDNMTSEEVDVTILHFMKFDYYEK